MTRIAARTLRWRLDLPPPVPSHSSATGGTVGLLAAVGLALLFYFLFV